MCGWPGSYTLRVPIFLLIQISVAFLHATPYGSNTTAFLRLTAPASSTPCCVASRPTRYFAVASARSSSPTLRSCPPGVVAGSGLGEQRMVKERSRHFFECFCDANFSARKFSLQPPSFKFPTLGSHQPRPRRIHPEMTDHKPLFAFAVRLWLAPFRGTAACGARARVCAGGRGWAWYSN